MRTLLAILIAASFLPVARGDDAARAVVEQAIQAHGGAAVLNKYPAGRAKAKGTITLRGTEFPFTTERVFQMPRKLRITFEVVSQNVQRTVTEIVNGNSVAAFAGGLAQELPQFQIEELRRGVYVENLTRLTPLLDDKKIKIAAFGEKPIEGQPAVGILVSSDGQKDVRLYFDSQTHLLVGVERPSFDDLGKAVQQLEVYGGYREANGLKYSTQTLIKQNGRRYLKSEIIEFKPLEKVDSREFQTNPS